MRYGFLGGFIKFAFAKTAFSYIEKEIPEMDMPSYRKRRLRSTGPSWKGRPASEA